MGEKKKKKVYPLNNREAIITISKHINLGIKRSRGKCGKQNFTEIEADVALDLAKRKRAKNPWRREVRKYFCDVCNAYHLTSIYKHKQ